MIYPKHCSTLSLIYMLTTQQSATLLTIRWPPMLSLRAYRRTLSKSNWSSSNKMLLNESKTKSMLVTGKRLVKKMEHSTLQLHLKSSELNQVHSHKLLGVAIDSQLSFDQHVDGLCKKLPRRVAVLRKKENFIIMQWLSRQCYMPQRCGHPFLYKTFGKCSGYRNVQPV